MIEYDIMVIDASDYFECPVKTRGVSIGGFYVDRLKQFANRLFANGVADRLNGFPSIVLKIIVRETENVDVRLSR